MWTITQRGADRVSFLNRDGWIENISWGLVVAAGAGCLLPLGWSWNLWYLAAPVGVGFIILGVRGIVRREGLDVEAAPATVTVWSRVLIPLRLRTLPAASFDHILLEPPVRHGSPRAPLWMHPVALRGPGDLRLAVDAATPEEAEDFAAALGGILKLPVRRSCRSDQS